MDLSPILDGLNDAQRAAVTAPDVPVLVLAGAGSGKTRVLTHRIAWLVQVEGVSPHGILAVTFTNKAAAEMRARIERMLGMPGRDLWIGTFHGIAHRLLRLHWREAGLSQGFQILDAEDQLRLIKKLIRAQNLDETRWVPRELMYFINSHKDAGRRPDAIRNVQDPITAEQVRLYREYEAACARAGVVDFAELLLRAFELWRDHPDLLAHYRRRFAHVLVDEFQDTNGIQYAWLKLLAGGEGKPFIVGDDDQCVPAGTLVTMADRSQRAIETIRIGEQVLSNFGRGELRPSTVTAVFHKPRRAQLVRIRLASGRQLRSTPEHTHFAGYVLGRAPQTHFLYLMHKEGKGYRLGVSQVYTRGQVKPMVGIKQRALHEHADAVWIIRTHADPNAARFDEMMTSLRYGLPTLPFVPRKGGSTRGLVHDSRYIDEVFRSIDTAAAADRLLGEVGLDPDRPHHVPRSRNSNRRNIVITLCGDRRGARPMHRISIVGVDSGHRGCLEALGLSVRPTKRDRISWRFETVRKDFGELMQIARQIRDQLDGRYILQGHMLDRSLPFISASGIRAGMVMATGDGEYDVVESIDLEPFDGTVHDLNVADTHNFVADGIVTHNSIYRWRGAQVENLHQFRRDFPSSQLFRLEQNYRSTGNILAAANGIIAQNSGRLGKTLWTDGERGEPVRLYAAFNERDEAEFVTQRIREWVAQGGQRREVAILYRSNAQSRVFEEAFISARMPYRVYGGLRFFERAEIKDALAYLRLIVQRRDDNSFERVVNLPTRGIGAKTLDTVREYARGAGCSLWEAAAACIAAESLGTKGAAVHAFLQLIERLAREIAGRPLHEQVERVLEGSGLLAHHGKDKADRGEARVENLEELVSAAHGFTPEGGGEDEQLSPLESFLAHAVLESGEGQADPYADSVQMMTLHTAKGLEFPMVFLTGLEDGLFPHQRSVADLDGLEEERRLCYVGMTRAMRQLWLTYAEQRRLHGVDTYGQPSRFIREIPEELIEEVRPRLQVSRPVAAGRFRPPEEASVGGVRLGARVRHGKFGEGVILNVEGSGAHARVQVNFAGEGTKWLMVQYANLTPL